MRCVMIVPKTKILTPRNLSVGSQSVPRYLLNKVKRGLVQHCHYWQKVLHPDKEKASWRLYLMIFRITRSGTCRFVFLYSAAPLSASLQTWSTLLSVVSTPKFLTVVLRGS